MENRCLPLLCLKIARREESHRNRDTDKNTHYTPLHYHMKKKTSCWFVIFVSHFSAFVQNSWKTYSISLMVAGQKNQKKETEKWTHRKKNVSSGNSKWFVNVKILAQIPISSQIGSKFCLNMTSHFDRVKNPLWILRKKEICCLRWKNKSFV